MLQGSTENTAREIAIEQLNTLAKTATLYEIKAAAAYLVKNLSEHTTKQMLAVFENEISKLLGKAPDHNDTINCRTAIECLRAQLPNGIIQPSRSAILNAYTMVRLDEEEPEFAASHTYDDHTPLLLSDKKKKHKY